MSVELSGWRKRQIALDKKAENARQLGLDYEPDKTIEMARKAGFMAFCYPALIDKEDLKKLESFAALVRADERNRTWTPEHWTEYEPIHQWRQQHSPYWYDGYPDNNDGGGPYETRILYATPQEKNGRKF